MSVDRPPLKPVRSSLAGKGSLVLFAFGLVLAGWEVTIGDIASALVVAGIAIVGFGLALWRRKIDGLEFGPYLEGASFRFYLLVLGLGFMGAAVWLVDRFFAYRRVGLAFHAGGSLVAAACAAFLGILAIAVTVAIQRVVSGKAGRFAHWLYRPNQSRERPRIVSWLGVLIAIAGAVVFVGILVEDEIVK